MSNWQPLANGIWDNEYPWQEELDLVVEDLDQDLLFASHSHRCPFLGSHMSAEIVVNLRDQTYLVLGWTETQSIEVINVDFNQNVVFYIFSDGRINVYSLNQPFQLIQQFNKTVPGLVERVDFNDKDSSLTLRTRQYNPELVEFTETIYYNFRDIAYNALEDKLPTELMEKIILDNNVPLMYSY